MSKLLKQLNDNQNKVADTNGIMQLQAWDYGVAQDLTNKQITATIANASGFLFDIDLVSNGTEIDLDFKDSQLQKLTPDTYFLEIKVTDEAGYISVFPTEGYATFTINKNLHATEGTLVPQITFDTVLADVKTAMDKTVADYVKTIAKGDKGDTGPQGPAGKDAEMPVVGGRNLLLDTGRSFTGIGTNSIHGSFLGQGGQYFLAGGKKVSDLYNQYEYITLSFDWVASGDIISGNFNVEWDNTPWTGIGSPQSDGLYIQPSNTNKSGHYEVTVTLNNKDYATGIATGIKFRQDNLQGNIKISNIKLEAGNVASDWTPAPEDKADNANVVHVTGNETITDTKTFTSPITGALATRFATFTDFAVVAKNMITYSGNWYVTDKPVTNDPLGGMMNYYIVSVTSANADTAGIIVVTKLLNNQTYITGVSLGNIIGWRVLANDSSVVHNTDNETIAGNKTLTGLTTMLTGNYGLRVTSSGFQKTTDGGKTWVTANL